MSPGKSVYEKRHPRYPLSIEQGTDTVPDDGPLDRTLVIVMTSGPLDLGGPDTDFYDTSEMMQRSTWNLPAAVKVVEKYDLRYRVCHIHHKLSSQ